MEIEIHADEVDAHGPDDEYLECVWFRDRNAHRFLSLSRFAGPSDEDDGRIEVMLADQLHASTEKLSVALHPTKLVAAVDPAAAAQLRGVDSVVVYFRTDETTFARLCQTLRNIFRDLTG